jgi:crotonobetainyl-CoA:carnitine CoA-transferase CaiB-like acyl-CoA transferase
MSTGDGPLSGLRALDFSVVWAGPYTSEILADLGAEVIKVENVHGWQPHTRGAVAHITKEEAAANPWYATFPDGDPGEKPYERDPWYLPLLRNKRSVTINYQKPEGQALLHRLVAKSDIVWENNVPSTMERLGITYEQLSKHNPGLIMLRAPAFGLSGEYKNRRGFGVHIEAFIGHTVLRGYPDDDVSTNTMIFAGDYQTAAVGVFAVLAALHHRDKTGRGQLIELAQAENSSQMFPQAIMDYVLNGRLHGTIGNRDVHGCAPNGVYQCAGEDRWIAISVRTDEEWWALADALGRRELAKDPRFATAADREAHQDDLDAMLAEYCRGQEALSLAARLQARGVGAGPVMDPRDALASPQLRERGYWERIPHKFTGTWEWPGPPFMLSSFDHRPSLPPPGLGEHNEYVYKQVIGITDAEYDDLLARGEIGTEFDPSIP